MNNVINLYKPVGLTPLQAQEKFREQNPEYQDAKMSYAGRLDPLAEGVLLLLVDEENKNREKYQNLDKEYEFEVLFGVATDTYDFLGIVTNKTRRKKARLWGPRAKLSPLPELSPKSRALGNSGFVGSKAGEKIKKFTTSLMGKRQQPYPPFSSFQIDKKPLFQWAKEGKLDQIKIPTREIEIYDIKHLETYFIKVEKLHQLIVERVNKVRGKFRQKEILKRWEMFFEKVGQGKKPIGGEGKELGSEAPELVSKNSSEPSSKSRALGNSPPETSKLNPKKLPTPSPEFPIMKFRVSCSSGTYVRSIANKMGKITGTGALALSIKRTRVGEYKLSNSTKLA